MPAKNTCVNSRPLLLCVVNKFTPASEPKVIGNGRRMSSRFIKRKISTKVFKSKLGLRCVSSLIKSKNEVTISNSAALSSLFKTACMMPVFCKICSIKFTKVTLGICPIKSSNTLTALATCSNPPVENKSVCTSCVLSIKTFLKLFSL